MRELNKEPLQKVSSDLCKLYCIYIAHYIFSGYYPTIPFINTISFWNSQLTVWINNLILLWENQKKVNLLVGKTTFEKGNKLKIKSLIINWEITVQPIRFNFETAISSPTFRKGVECDKRISLRAIMSKVFLHERETHLISFSRRGTPTLQNWLCRSANVCFVSLQLHGVTWL